MNEVHRGSAGTAHFAVRVQRSVHRERLERVRSEPPSQFHDVFSARVVKMLTGGKDLHPMGAGARCHFQQPWMQTLLQKQMRRKNWQHALTGPAPALRPAVAPIVS